MIPKRRKRERSGIARAPRRDFPAHRQWIRGHDCAVPGCASRYIEAAHFDGPVPKEDMGGKGLKRHDRWCFPLCATHHAEYHRRGWRAFDAKHGISTADIARAMARSSRHRHLWENAIDT